MGRSGQQGSRGAAAPVRRGAAAGSAAPAVDIIPIGAPGAGKSTQGKAVAGELGLSHISTGQIFRDAAAQDTEEGRKIADMLATGVLFPDEMLYPLIDGALRADENAAGVIFDGFPRTVAQAIEFDRMCEQAGRAKPVAVEFQLDVDTAVDRLVSRGGGRSDDTPETIAVRMAEFDKKTAPLLDYYREQGRLRTVNARRDVEDVKQQFTVQAVALAEVAQREARAAQIADELAQMNDRGRKAYGDVKVTRSLKHSPFGGDSRNYYVVHYGDKFETPSPQEAAAAIAFIEQHPEQKIVGSYYDSRSNRATPMFAEDAADHVADHTCPECGKDVSPDDRDAIWDDEEEAWFCSRSHYARWCKNQPDEDDELDEDAA